MSGILLASVGNSYGSLPVNVAVPTISGTVSIGSTLTSTTGTWTGSPAPTFAYQWQRGTTNISGATNSTYTIQLGDAGNTLRCVVTATNPLGSASANSANTASVPLPAIGSSLGGGFYAGQISTAGNSVADYFLIVSPKSSGEASSLQWKTTNTATAGTSSVIDGPTNSSNMNNATHPAAQFCEGLTIGGFSDWYMPAKNELEICYYNLKPTTASNSTGAGANTNAVPSRPSNYTAGTPAQTSAAAFQTGGAEALDILSPSSQYWASTELAANRGWMQDFANGGQGFTIYGFVKTATFVNVRAVRRVAV